MVWSRGAELEPLSAVLPRLYLGAERDVTQESLVSLDISFVLSVSRGFPRPSFVSSSRFLRVPIDDSLSADLLPWLPRALTFIDNALSSGSSVLVHCGAGVSRSPALTVAYIMHRLDMDLDHAYSFVKQCRPSISPNLNFLGQLQHFQNILRPGAPAPEQSQPPRHHCTSSPLKSPTGTPMRTSKRAPMGTPMRTPREAPTGATERDTEHTLPKLVVLSPYFAESCAKSEAQSESIREKRRSLTLSLTPLIQEPSSISPGPPPSKPAPVRAHKEQPSTDSLPLQRAEQGGCRDHKKALMSPLGLTLSRLLSWGERWLLAAPVRMGQAPLPYGC